MTHPLLFVHKTDIVTSMEMRDRIADALLLARPDPKQLSALALAYLGDTVYDLYVRTLLTFGTAGTVHTLHQKSTKLVCAKGQAEAFFCIQPMLDEEEAAVYRRGRNAHGATVPKNASVQEYRTATGFEALIGYLYCLGRDERIAELMRTALKKE